MKIERFAKTQFLFRRGKQKSDESRKIIYFQLFRWQLAPRRSRWNFIELGFYFSFCCLFRRNLNRIMNHSTWSTLFLYARQHCYGILCYENKPKSFLIVAPYRESDISFRLARWHNFRTQVEPESSKRDSRININPRDKKLFTFMLL